MKSGQLDIPGIDIPELPLDSFEREYILVTDRDSKILHSGSLTECRGMLSLIRKASGEATIFKALKY